MPDRPLGEDRTLDAARAEWEKSVKSLTPRPSTDTIPFEFSVGGMHFRVPRNYLITMDNWSGGPQGLVTIRVNLPDMKPLTPQNADCFRARRSDLPPGCEPFRFLIEGKPLVSTDQAFEKMRHVFRGQIPDHTEFGYEKYEIGPDNARTEYYRMVDDAQTRLYSCLINDSRGKRNGVCRPVMETLSIRGRH